MNRIGYRVPVRLPIDSSVSSQVMQTLKQLAEKSPATVRPQDRPVVVLEFETDKGQTGRGSELVFCMSLALYLGEPELNRIQTVAYIPGVSSDGETQNNGQLNGHAVLVAIAAGQIAMHPTASIGEAGIDEKQIKKIHRDVYGNVAAQRLTFPVPVVMECLTNQKRFFTRR